jgi:hypothetical protein
MARADAAYHRRPRIAWQPGGAALPDGIKIKDIGMNESRSGKIRVFKRRTLAILLKVR